MKQNHQHHRSEKQDRNFAWQSLLTAVILIIAALFTEWYPNIETWKETIAFTTSIIALFFAAIKCCSMIED